MNLIFLFACNNLESVPAASSEDFSAAVAASSDMDGNGVPDSEQSFVVGTNSDDQATVIVDPAQKSSMGGGSGQHPWFRGYGNGLYSSDEYGWATGFYPAVEATDASGQLVGYGNYGFRPGTYELTLAEEGAEIGSLDGWWDLTLGLKEGDMLEFLVVHVDGEGDCERESWHLAFRVWDNGLVTPLGDSIAPSDPNCYDE